MMVERLVVVDTKYLSNSGDNKGFTFLPSSDVLRSDALAI